MTKNPLVSIIIPAFNAGRFLEETLRSVQAQSYPHFEALIMDGGSADATGALAQKFAEADPRFKILRQSDRVSCHPRVSAARNEAFFASTGELIGFLDADDVWFPEKLARQVELFRQHPETNFAFANYYFWDGVKDLDLRYTSRNFPPDKPCPKLIYSCLYGLSTVVVRRELFARTNGFDETIPAAEDWDLWLRMAEAGMVTRGLREPLLRYRLHAGNASKNLIRADENALRFLEKNRDRARLPADRRHYQRAMQKTRGHMELVRARQLLETNPALAGPALFRAWRAHPRQLKWLWRWGCTVWPHALGGAYTAAYAHRKLREKF